MDNSQIEQIKVVIDELTGKIEDITYSMKLVLKVRNLRESQLDELIGTDGYEEVFEIVRKMSDDYSKSVGKVSELRRTIFLLKGTIA